AAMERIGGQLSFEETGPLAQGRHQFDRATMCAEVGDIVLARRDIGTSYHISVVVVDVAQAITEVTRDDDIFSSIAIHLLSQSLLALPQPRYHHHPLIRDADGKRLAKRDDARALSLYRAQGATPEDIRKMIGFDPKDHRP